MASDDISIDYDVVIIGAGISGICFAHRLQELHPELKYCLLEGRDEIGGTWSFFKYPGLRSDSDLFTFGFPWSPWNESVSIAKGDAIVRYMKRTMEEDGIDKHTKVNHRVKGLHWSSKSKSWATEVSVDSKPDNLDYQNKNVVIVRSRATAITILPAMAAGTNHITMLQRSPGYIMSVPTKSTLERFISAVLPAHLAHKLVRLKWIIVPAIFRAYCTRFPKAARRRVLKASQAALGRSGIVDPNFEPRYDPFEQRMCLCPDGDIFEVLRSGKASIKTGVIEAVTGKSIKLESGEELHPDIIVTATGLKLQLGGHIKIDVDGQPIHLNKHHVWKGLMIEGLPNLVFSFGYLDASWTLGVDVSAKLACRIITEMQKEGAQAVVPQLSAEERQNMKDERFMPRKSTYVEKALSVLPKNGDKPQWRGRYPYFRELLGLKLGDTRTGLQYIW